MEQICNTNSKIRTSENIYNAFNEFIFSTDIKVIGKLLYRFDFFQKIKNIPGDIVEIGVFKGSGIATFSKFLEIYCPNSNKKIIGFDMFKNNEQEILDKYDEKEKKYMNVVYSRVDENDLTIQSVTNRLDNMNIHKKYILVEGDVEYSVPEFVKNNPGFRISLLYIDCDLDKPTYYSLKYLWDRILPGGIIVFDEYEYHSFSESNGVDRFLKENNISYNVISTNFLCPTAYIIKN
jgi:hypothetical protein